MSDAPLESAPPAHHSQKETADLISPCPPQSSVHSFGNWCAAHRSFSTSAELTFGASCGHTAFLWVMLQYEEHLVERLASVHYVPADNPNHLQMWPDVSGKGANHFLLRVVGNWAPGWGMGRTGSGKKRLDSTQTGEHWGE